MNTPIISEGFRGNVMLIRNGEAICEYSGGFSDLANEIPNTIDTRFATASAGKAFVAVGILQLIEAGRLDLEDTIGELLDIDLHNIDPGVSFISEYNPNNEMIFAAVSNYGDNVWELMRNIRKAYY